MDLSSRTRRAGIARLLFSTDHKVVAAAVNLPGQYKLRFDLRAHDIAHRAFELQLALDGLEVDAGLRLVVVAHPGALRLEESQLLRR